MNRAAHQLVNQTSGEFEYYTPHHIIEAARGVMGGIDLDPASSPAGNERVKARRFFTEQDDGLQHGWRGRVWMNHPFSAANNKLWPRRLVDEYRCGNVSQALCITYAATSEAWFQCLAAWPQCYLCPRTNYVLPDGSLKKGVTKGSVVTYLGQRQWKFAEAFAPFGFCKARI